MASDTAIEKSNQETQDALDSPTRRMYRYPTRRPAEVEEGSVDAEAYAAYRSTTDLREPYRIPRAYLQSTKPFLGPELAEAPLIVFINSRSGGHAGPKLTETLFRALGHAQVTLACYAPSEVALYLGETQRSQLGLHMQVFDLLQFRPGPVLRQIWQNFEQQKLIGDRHAESIQRRFRILCAGGDGTVAWILKTIHELKLEPAPQVAIMPLGTGNDLSLSFGWGNAFLQKWIDETRAVYDTLKRVADAEARELDAWQIKLSTDQSDMFAGLPHSLESPDDIGTQVQGLFWNYFSMGMDAKAAYGFHSLREKRPWAASGRMVNQAWYAYYSCSSGWFCAAPPLRNKLSIQVRNAEGEWVDLKLKGAIKALVLLNLQSYGGGRDLWGLQDVAKDKAKGWRTPIFNDGLIEVVGLKNGWHTGAVMGGVSKAVHAKRLAQASAVRLELKASGARVKGERGLSHMQLDGEPWAQAIPAGEAAPLVVEVTPAGRSKMLFNASKMKGVDARIVKLAEREGRVSRAASPELADANGASASPSPFSPAPAPDSSTANGSGAGVTSNPTGRVTTTNPAADEEREIALTAVPVPVPANSGISSHPVQRSDSDLETRTSASDISATR